MIKNYEDYLLNDMRAVIGDKTFADIIDALHIAVTVAYQMGIDNGKASVGGTIDVVMDGQPQKIIMRNTES